MNIWFTSDHHFWHTNVIKYCNRPFKTVEEMNEVLIKNWNESIKPDDIVYYLGDFSMAFRAIELFSNKLNGIKFLVPGNHDFCHPAHKKCRTLDRKNRWLKKYDIHGWKVLSEYNDIDIPKINEVALCHLPYLEPNTNEDQRYKEHRPIDKGKILLCGHVHDNWKTRTTDKGTLMINVGVDVWDYKPVSLDQIKELICTYKDK